MNCQISHDKVISRVKRDYPLLLGIDSRQYFLIDDDMIIVAYGNADTLSIINDGLIVFRNKQLRDLKENIPRLNSDLLCKILVYAKFNIFSLTKSLPSILKQISLNSEFYLKPMALNRMLITKILNLPSVDWKKCLDSIFRVEKCPYSIIAQLMLKSAIINDDVELLKVCIWGYSVMIEYISPSDIIDNNSVKTLQYILDAYPEKIFSLFSSSNNVSYLMRAILSDKVEIVRIMLSDEFILNEDENNDFPMEFILNIVERDMFKLLSCNSKMRIYSEKIQRM